MSGKKAVQRRGIQPKVAHQYPLAREALAPVRPIELVSQIPDSLFADGFRLSRPDSHSASWFSSYEVNSLTSGEFEARRNILIGLYLTTFGASPDLKRRGVIRDR
jgi:hypothetical protein